MNNRKGIYIYQDKWVESTALSNPLNTLDHKMKEEYNDFYNVNYDLKLVAIEINDLLDNYNRYKEQIAQISIEELEQLSVNNKSKRVLLNGFNKVNLILFLNTLKMWKYFTYINVEISKIYQ